MAAEAGHESIVRLLAHLGARLLYGKDDRGFWWCYHDTDKHMPDFWRSVIVLGGDEPTEESRSIRRRMMIKAGMHDPRAGGLGLPDQFRQVWPICHAGGDNQGVCLPTVCKPLADQAGAFCEKQAGFGAALLSFKTFQGLDERV